MCRNNLSRLLNQVFLRLVFVSTLGLGTFALAEEAGDPVAGASKAATCVACHGADGNSTIPDYPNIAGQNANYLESQMLLMRDGERAIPLMAGQLDAMSDQDIRDMAAHYARQPAKIGQASPENLKAGEMIYRGGILDKQVAACTACHAPDGNGNSLAGFPRIAGQPSNYTIEQLRAYREEQRDSDESVGGMMRAVAARMTDSEMAAVANYIQGLY